MFHFELKSFVTTLFCAFVPNKHKKVAKNRYSINLATKISMKIKSVTHSMCTVAIQKMVRAKKKNSNAND